MFIIEVKGEKVTQTREVKEVPLLGESGTWRMKDGWFGRGRIRSMDFSPIPAVAGKLHIRAAFLFSAVAFTVP